MQPVFLESQPDLELNQSIHAYRPDGDLRYASFDANSLDGLVTHAATNQTRVVVLNFPDSDAISATAMGDLKTLQGRLAPSHCMLMLLAENPTLRELFLGVGLNRFCIITGNRGELNERLELATNPPEDGITEETLAEAMRAGVSFEDILREKNL